MHPFTGCERESFELKGNILGKMMLILFTAVIGPVDLDLKKIMGSNLWERHYFWQ